MANLMLSIMGAFAEFERALIRERQREGIVLAKQRGAYKGRKKSLRPDQVAELRRRAEAGEQKTALAEAFGISRDDLSDLNAKIKNRSRQLLFEQATRRVANVRAGYIGLINLYRVRHFLYECGGICIIPDALKNHAHLKNVYRHFY
jgi:DNA invertase Pin-like site-specific DNA recombinase